MDNVKCDHCGITEDKLYGTRIKKIWSDINSTYKINRKSL